MIFKSEVDIVLNLYIIMTRELLKSKICGLVKGVVGMVDAVVWGSLGSVAGCGVVGQKRRK